MVEYTAVVIAFSALTFLLAEIGFRMQNGGVINGEDIGVLDWIKVLFLLGSLGMGFFLVALSMGIASENAASAAFQSLVSTGYIIWGFVFLAVLVCFVVYYVWWVPTKLTQMLRKKRRDI